MMSRLTHRNRITESGSGFVEFAMCVPVVLALVLFAADTYQMASAMRQADLAAQAAAREAASLIDAGQAVSDDYIIAFAQERAPLLEGVSVQVHRATPTTRTYVHHIWDGDDAEDSYADDSFVARPSNVQASEVTVEIEGEVNYVTPMGTVLALVGSSESADSFHVWASYTAPYDSTVNPEGGSGW